MLLGAFDGVRRRAADVLSYELVLGVFIRVVARALRSDQTHAVTSPDGFEAFVAAHERRLRQALTAAQRRRAVTFNAAGVAELPSGLSLADTTARDQASGPRETRHTRASTNPGALHRALLTSCHHAPRLVAPPTGAP